MICISIIILLKLTVAFGLFIDNSGYLGCYVNNLLQHEFNTFAGHLDHSKLTPLLCVKACSAIGFSLAAIEKGTMCFCKKSNTIFSVKDVDANCQSIACVGDPLQACGSQTNLLVYGAGPLSTISKIGITSLANQKLNSTSAISIFSPINIELDFIGTTTNLFINDDREDVGNQNLSDASSSYTFNYTLVNTGQRTIELIISPSTGTSYQSSRISTGLPYVIDSLRNISLSCPNSILYTDNLNCTLSFVAGTNLQATISYGDGAKDTCNLMDVNTEYYGGPVPKFLENNELFNMGTQVYLATNAEIKIESYLRAIELYAESAGSIQIDIMRWHCGSSGQVPRNFDYTCDSLSLSTTYSCASTSSFSTTNQTCSNTLQSGRFASYQSSAPMSLTSIATFSLNMKQGYNLFTESDLVLNLQLLPGDLIQITGVSGGGAIGVDMSGDASLTDYLFSSNYVTPINSASNWRFYIRAIVSPNKMLSVFHNYTSIGIYNVSVSLSNIISGYTQSTSQSVIVESPITGLQILTVYSTTICFLNVACGLQALVLTGSNLKYQWTITSSNVFYQVNSTQNTISYAFNQTNDYNITVYVSNTLSNAMTTATITVQANLIGLYFKSGNSSLSSSIVNQNANFLFYLVAGANYNCSVDYGDGTYDSFSDSIYNLNNTNISHVYSSERIYKVYINCTNPVNSLNLTFNHTVQYPLVGLALTSNGTRVKSAYSVKFTVSSGSAPYIFGFYFDNTLDTGALYSNLAGQSSSHSAETSPTIHQVYIYICNYVSCVQLNGTFEISSPISGANFTIVPTNNILTGYTYSYPTQLQLRISMLAGSNILIYINTDSSSSYSALASNLIQIQTYGDWFSNINDLTNRLYAINYTYSNPGDYTIFVNISNVLGYASFTQAVRVISRVDSLIPGLAGTTNNYVTYLSSQSTGTPQFVFSYSANTKAGSHSTVTFWPGDDNNATFGPFPLSMDFNANVSKTQLQYDYSSTGVYQVSFYVVNPLGSKVFTYVIQVVSGMYGFYISVDPLYSLVGSAVTVSSYLMQGQNVTYTWTQNGVTFATTSRLSRQFIIPDNQQYIPSTVGNYSILVKATDSYSTINDSYTLEVQNPLSSISVSVSPNTPQINIDSIAASRTFVFTINYYPTTATNVYYIIDFGDNSLINLPTFMSSSTKQISYTYATSGLFNVNITLFNKVSSFSQAIQVEIDANFFGFDCVPYWRALPTDSSVDIPYNLSNGSYYVKKEYDIRFYCTWLRLDAVALEFDLYLNGVLMSTITNIASLTKLSYSHSTGYIIPYASSLITSQGPLQIQVKNSLFSQTSVSNIIPISVPLNVKWSDPRYAFVLGSPMTFNLTFDSLGQPSCTLVSYTLWSNPNSTKILGFIGSSKDYCTSAFSTYSTSMNSLYLGAYTSFSLTSNALTFSTSAVTQVGRYYLTANVQSPGINSIIAVCNFTAVASSSACELPYVDIVNKSSIFYSPQNYMRTDMVILTGTTELNCSSGLANQKQWYLYKVNDQTGALGAQISLSSNPTVNYAQLVIQPSTLSFGLYSAIYQVSMTYNPTLYTDTAQTYFEVAPTGIAIASLPGTLAGGTFEQTIGTNQTILLDPVTYSYDLDSLANISALNFKFYCKVIDNGVEYDYPQLFYGVNLDLLTLLNNYSSNQNIQQFFNPNNSHSCFKSINDFSFDASKNKVTIRAGGLAYVAKRIYEILVQTSYYGAQYYQLLRFDVQNVNSVPLLSIGCKISGLCIPYEDYVKINPSTELLIDGDCQSGCTNLFDLEYKFNLYQSWYLPPKQVWYLYNNNSGILGSTTKELVLETNLFSENPLVVIWKIEFYLTATTATNGIASGTASMLIKVNQLPMNGTCSISPSSGISGNTTFVISCSNWVDSDGYVSSYSFNSLYSGQQTTTSIGSNSIGSISSQLPVGAVYDSYNLYISVNIIDNDNGVTTYQIPNPVVVQPAQTDLASIIQQLLDPNSPNSLNSILYSGNSQLTTQTILSISSMLNGASLSDNLALAALGNSTLPATFGALSSYDGVVATPNMTEEQYIANQNLQAQLRQYLSSFINNISVSNIDSILQQSAMLNELTSSTNSITRTMADSVTNQCIRLIEALMNLSSDTSSQDVNTAAVSLTGTLGNIISGLSTYLNGRVSSLDLDQESSEALPTYYDTDLENFWTNPNNFFGDYGADATEAQVALSKNIQYQQFLNVDVAQKVNTITDLIGNLVASRFATGQSYNMVTSSLAMQISKLQATNLPNQVNIENAVVQMPTFCDLTTNANSITTTTTSSPYINPMDSYNCTNRIITLKSILLPMANSGHNGKNESFIGFSYSIGLSFLDQDGIEIDITNTLKPIELHIPRDSNLLNNDYLYVNVSPASLNVSAGSQFLPNALFIYAVNASLHIQIKPNNSNIGYLALVKFGSTPILNATAAIYDYWTFLCPNSVDYQHVNDSNGAVDSYYLLFMNMKQVKGFRGFVGYGLRELTTSEVSSYCSSNNVSISSPPLMGANQSLFTSDFWLKSYTSGCYYYDSNTGKWSNDGMEIYSDTTLVYTHCSTNHLTQFAGGLLIVPNEINLSRLPVNASPVKSPLIYVVTILVTCVYIGFWIWAFKRDRFDAKQKGIIILPDNIIGDNYCYEIIVYTGNRREAATDSKVKLVINGDFDETSERLLDSRTRPVFRCGGVDSFLMTVNRPLGTLNYLRVWHDNSGEGAMASWYLRHIIVHDLQTRELFHFPCYSWLAVERSDGKIDRTLGVAGATQLRKIAFEEKRSMRDGHLWLSMFTKPLLSPLMRVDRVECSFLMLYLFMVVHILYYGAVDFEISGEEKIGPFIIQPEQIFVGILTNLFVFLLCRLLIAIFKRCKVRITKSSKLKKAIDDNMKINRIEEFSSLYKEDDHKEEETSDADSKADKYAQIKDSKPKRRLLAPWWIRPTLHFICNVVILACAVLLMIKGIEYGETMCEKWFTSLLISFIISLILWQPLQVILSAYIYVKICKKRSNLSQEFDFEHEFDHEDNKKSLNKYFKAENAIYRTNPFKLTQFENSNLTQYQLTDARNSRVREVRIWQAIREISIYAGFILVLFYVTYTNIGKSAFDYQNAMKNTFVISDELSSVSDLWTWLMNTAAPGLRANTWYNGQQPYGLAGYINDVSSRMIGYALLRQVRVRPGSCTLDGHVKPYIDFCDSDYHLSSVDSTDYGYSWSQFNSSFVPPNGMQQVYAAFQYQDSNTLQGYPITGDYNTYFGDGYVYQMRGSLAFLKGNLSLLQQLDWINRETRAVFVEFALYNPNINQVIVAEILIEILPTGRLLTQVRFDPLNLFNEVNGGSGIAIKIFAYVLYLIFIVYFTCMEIKQLVKEGPRLYFSRFWNYVEWLLIVFSLAAFALFFYRLSQAYAVLDFFKQTSGYGYIKLQIVSFWNQVLTASLGACCVFGTIRFLKLFRFYKKIYALALTLKFCIREILGFSIMFAFVWVAFVQMLYLYFYDKLVSYSSPLNAFTTSFECLVGKFDKNLMLSTQYALGPIIFVIYPIIMAFMMINIFITIVCEAFKEVRSDIRKSGNELEIMDYFKTKYENWRRNGKTDRSQVSSEKYLDISQKLPQNVDRLIHNLAKAYEEDIYIDRLLSKQDNMQD